MLEVGNEAADGRLGVELCRVPVDLGRTLEAARASGMPHLDWWVGMWADDRSGEVRPVGAD